MKRTALLLALMLAMSLLCGCVETPPPATTAPPRPTETTAPPETVSLPESLPEDTYLCPEIQTTAPTETLNNFSEYEALLDFSAEPNWLSRAIGCVFEKPEDVDLYFMFYLGVEHPGSWDEISEESRQSLIGQGFWPELDLQIMPVEKLEEALQATFGIGLANVTIPEHWGYIEAEDAYCSNHSDAYFPGVPVIVDVEDDGTDVFIHYTIEGYYDTAADKFMDRAELTLHLERTGDGRLLAVSNLLAP